MSREPSKHPGSLHRKWSRQVVDGPERAASRGMLHAVGFAREDFTLLLAVVQVGLSVVILTRTH